MTGVAQARNCVGKQPHQLVGKAGNFFAVLRTARLVLGQQRWRPGVGRARNQLGGSRDITQAEIESLGGDRMQSLGRIARENHAWGGDALAHHAPQRVTLPAAAFEQLAQAVTETLLQLAQEFLVAPGHDARGLASGHGPNQGAALIRTR